MDKDFEYLDEFKTEVAISTEYFNWLIEQAEKVEELRKENWELNKEIGGYAGRVDALTEEFEMLTGRLKLLKQEMFAVK
jgi:uncharacterized coiled-coil DUF342 family protein